MSINKKNIAICFWGQTRTFRTLNETYANLNHKNLNIDYFASTWNDFKNKKPFDNFKDKEFLDPSITEFKNNTERALYLIHRVNKLKSDYELKNNFIYDYILWTRNGILFEVESLLNYLLEKSKNHEPLEVNTHSKIRYEKGLYRLDSDYYFGGTSVAFDIYANGWKYYFKSKESHEMQGTNGGHHAHAFIIKEFGLTNIIYQQPHQFLFNKNKKREV